MSVSLRNLFITMRNRFQKPGVILAYRSIGMDGLPFMVKSTEFENQMRFLKQSEYKVIPLSEMCVLLRKGISLSGCVALTFDDGYADFFKYAFPVLKRNGFSATVFVMPGKLGSIINQAQGKTPLRIMTADEVRRATTASDLIEFMPQSYSQAVREIEASRHGIETLTKKPADILAYSGGDKSSDIVAYLRSGDLWLGAVTRDEGPVRPGDDPYKLKRVSVGQQMTFQRFKKLFR